VLETGDWEGGPDIFRDLMFATFEDDRGIDCDWGKGMIKLACYSETFLQKLSKPFCLSMMIFLAASPWLHMPMSVSSEAIIPDGMRSPIMVAAFPSMKTIQPEGITD